MKIIITRGRISNENDSEDTEASKTSTIPNFMLQILPNDEIEKGINFLNSKQREVFNVVHTWAKDYEKYDEYYVEPTHILLSGSGGTSKSHMEKVIYNAKSKTLLCHCKHPDKGRVLLLVSKGISAVNIRGTTIHSSLGIKAETKLLVLNGKSKATLINRLSERKLLIID